MRFFLSLLFAALLPALAAPMASAQLSQIDMTDREIRDFLGGNTIGAHNWGDGDEISLEYHSRDGVALWNEAGELSVGLYRVKNGRVCYTYEGPNLGEWYCWEFKKDRRTSEVTQWAPFGSSYRLFVHAEGDVVSDL